MDYFTKQKLPSPPSFETEKSLESRLEEAQRIKAKHPDRVPVLVEKAVGSQAPSIDKKKFLVPSDLTFGQFIYVIRKRLRLDPEMALFLFVNNVLPSSSTTLDEIYKLHKSDDLFLYVVYDLEKTFGQ